MTPARSSVCARSRKLGWSIVAQPRALAGKDSIDGACSFLVLAWLTSQAGSNGKAWGSKQRHEVCKVAFLARAGVIEIGGFWNWLLSWTAGMPLLSRPLASRRSPFDKTEFDRIHSPVLRYLDSISHHAPATVSGEQRHDRQFLCNFQMHFWRKFAFLQKSCQICLWVISVYSMEKVLSVHLFI